MKGDPLRGVHAFYAASAREWWAPLYPQRRVFRRNALVAVLDKPSEFAGRAVHEWTAQVFRDETGPILSGQYRLMIRTEREKAREKKKYDAVELAPYTDEQIDEIDAQYEREHARGSEPRWWEDVEEGDDVGPMVKGPLTVTDMICWHAGMGMGLYGVRPLRLGYQNRAPHPALLPPRPAERPRRDAARALGSRVRACGPATRPPTTTAACARPGSSTCAPTGWATTRGCGSSTASSAGSTTWATRSGCAAGSSRKYLAEGDRPAVDLELEAVNQRGELTTPGHATILLPSREHGAVRLPDPPGGATRSAGRARSDLGGVLAPMSDAPATQPVDGLAVALDDGRAATHARPARQAQRDRRRDDGRARSTR